jgi:hypothetical protein
MSAINLADTFEDELHLLLVQKLGEARKNVFHSSEEIRAYFLKLLTVNKK